ncbi:Cdc7p-Dbf4p kinase complex regulatory subunit [Tilletia horrida]|nr:Cdc7p-Dbf4p kinase complex regulatory subunit [Tilletia horrida]KAK0566517.1 Cdc7p-Dbf4p kinase complex regulatory subunit [Tilletia horrida]
MERRPLQDKVNTPRASHVRNELSTPPQLPGKTDVKLLDHERGRVGPYDKALHLTRDSHLLEPRRADSHILQTARSPLAATLTPQKRKVPQDFVHARNRIDENHVSPSPPKKFRTVVRDHARHVGTVPGNRVPHPSRHSPGGRVGQAHLPIPSTSQRLPQHQHGASTKPAPVVTTKRIDKKLRISEEEQRSNMAGQQEKAATWRYKFRKAFPTFVFYLDGYDTSTRTQIENAVRSLGARVEPFFSKGLTHLVTTRPVPALPVTPAEAASAGKNAAATASGPKVGVVNAQTIDVTGRSRPGQSTQTLLAARATHREVNKTVPLHSDRNPFDEPGPVPAANDIAYKAKELGIKVWHHSKLNTILNMLLGDQSTTVNQAAKEDLGTLLRREKVEGTTERDPTAPRADYYYFSKNVHYLLVEDATKEHRPIMTQEFPRPKDQSSLERPPWPRLFGELEGKCPFTFYDMSKHANRTDRRPTAEKSLRRAMSMTQIGVKPDVVTEEAVLNEITNGVPTTDANTAYLQAEIAAAAARRRGDPGATTAYPLASGNSVRITSNIASTALTSTTSHGPGSFGLAHGQTLGGGAHGASGSGAFPHGRSALAQMSRRTQTIGVPKEPEGEFGTVSRSTSMQSLSSAWQNGGLYGPAKEGVGRLKESLAAADGLINTTVKADNSRYESTMGKALGVMGPPQMSVEEHRRRATALSGLSGNSNVSALLGTGGAIQRPGWPQVMQRKGDQGLGGIRRSVSVNEGLRAKARAEAILAAAQSRAKENKPGYCENCRVKFENLEEHARTKKHMRFANNQDNFFEVDQLIERCHERATP